MKLIKLQDKFILVSDEETLSQNGDFYLGYPNYDTIFQWKMEGMHEGKSVWINKIIAGIPELPVTDFSLLSEEDCKTIGLSTIDLTKLCCYDQRNPDFQIKEEYGYDKEEVNATGNFAKKDCACDNCFYGRAELTEQLITAQYLNDKMFSLEDIDKAIEYGHSSKMPFNEDWYDEFIQSLQQTSWDVEVEMQPTEQFDEATSIGVYVPKITNNSVKITKII